MHRPRADTPKVKQLEKLKLEEKLKIITKFVKKNIKKYYKIAAK